MTATLVDIRNASFDRGGTRVFDGLTLQIDSGEQVAILGPNGAGKSTLLKALDREIYPRVSADSHFRLLGRKRWNVSQLRRELGIVSSDLERRYREDTTALDVVLSGFTASIGVHGLVAQEISDAERGLARRALNQLGLSGLAERQFGRLSSGERRRTLLARALVHEPHTLILDEPLNGLDVAAAFALLHTLSRLVRRGVSLVMVTHNVAEILPEIDRIVVLSAGRIVADGPKADVLTGATLSRAFSTPLRVVRDGPWYLVRPADIADTADTADADGKL